MPRLAEYALTTGDVAEQLGAHKDSVARWADAGRIACVRSPGGWRMFRQADVDAFAEELAATGARTAS